MKRNAAGAGSTLVILVFSTLCLTILSLISLSASNIDKAMADAEARMVLGYYEADTLAERIVSEIIKADETPSTVDGVTISTEGGTASFSCPISDVKELYVEIELNKDYYEIIEWRMRDTAEWEKDSGLPVWSGE